VAITNPREPSESLRIAITLGDPRGIGPEIVSKALEHFRSAAPRISFTLIGPEPAPFAGSDPYVPVRSWSPADIASAGRVAGSAIEHAVALALAGDVGAIVTAPIDKAALHAAGYPYPGHTEMLAALSGTPVVGMMMCAEETRLGGPLRVVLATTHLPLARVPAALTRELLIDQAALTAASLQDHWGISAPRLAICAFNPHASDNGLFGDEEARILAPAIEELRRRGITAAGPIPADTVFTRALRGEFDAVIAPYHDVGMAAFKTASFGQGVNVTLGLPFPRTSPDHGTALDIAGTGAADPSSMIEAIDLAVKLALMRDPKTTSRYTRAPERPSARTPESP
jgi:4-hydroxythreonine-4-phosphate dehydrogenase